MATAEVEQLIKMVNQIARNVAVGESDQRIIEKTAGHIQRFWAASMKREILHYVECDEEGLEPLALAAVQQLLKS
jgi:formate dehydrogenase subunit delta